MQTVWNWDYKELQKDFLAQEFFEVFAGFGAHPLELFPLVSDQDAVDIINHQAIVEASGNVKLDTVNAIASTGVDIISSSAIVAKAPTLDLALDM